MINKPLTAAELGELLMETTQRDCGVWPEDQPDPGEEGDTDGRQYDQDEPGRVHPVR